MYWVYPLLKGSNRAIKQLEAHHPKGTPTFSLRMNEVGFHVVIKIASWQFGKFLDGSFERYWAEPLFPKR